MIARTITRRADGDTLDQITELLGGLGTVTVTEDGILFTPNLEGLEPLRTGTVTTCGRQSECPHRRWAGQ